VGKRAQASSVSITNQIIDARPTNQSAMLAAQVKQCGLALADHYRPSKNVPAES